MVHSGPGQWCSCLTHSSHGAYRPHRIPCTQLFGGETKGERFMYGSNMAKVWHHLFAHFYLEQSLLCHEAVLTVVTHFAFIPSVLTQTDEVIPGLDASAFVFTRVRSASGHNTNIKVKWTAGRQGDGTSSSSVCLDWQMGKSDRERERSLSPPPFMRWDLEAEAFHFWVGGGGVVGRSVAK